MLKKSNYTHKSMIISGILLLSKSCDMVLYMSKELNEFGNEIQDRLLEKGWSRSELARQAGLDVSTISRVMRGLQDATHPVVEKISDALKVDVSHLKTLAGLRVVSPPTDRDPRIEYIADRMNALPKQVREAAIEALGTQLDVIYRLSEN